MRRFAVFALVALAGCQRDAGPRDQPTATPTGLEAAAIQAGIIPDPASTDITGLYSRETDRVCIVPSATAYRIGVTVDYDDHERCSASGTVTRDRDRVHVTLDAPRPAAGCSFDARFDGDRIVFPGRLPAGCQTLCRDRASIAGLALDRLSESVAEAATLRDPRGRLLCGDDIR